MAYTRPDYDAADASWIGETAYTRLDYDAADAAFTSPSVDVRIADSGLPLAPEVVALATPGAFIEDTGLPLVPSAFAIFGVGAYLSNASPLQDPSAYAISGSAGYVLDGGLPLAPAAAAYSDPMRSIDFSFPATYVADLVMSDDELVRVPITAWQATQQVLLACNAQCTVPACAEWADDLADAEELVISCVGRQFARLGGEEVEWPLIRVAIQSVQDVRTVYAHDAIVFGTADSFSAPDTDIDPGYDRELRDARSMSVGPTNMNMRCAIDWLLQPGQRAVYGGYSYIASRIDYSAVGGDAYMDVVCQSAIGI